MTGRPALSAVQGKARRSRAGNLLLALEADRIARQAPRGSIEHKAAAALAAALRSQTDMAQVRVKLGKVHDLKVRHAADDMLLRLECAADDARAGEGR